MSTGVEFRVLGPVEVWQDGELCSLDGAKPRTVLAALLLAKGRMISDAQLSMMLWGEHPPTTMNAQIYTYVSRLRKLLRDRASIVRQGPGYLIRTGQARFDYADFERLSVQGRDELQASRYDKAARLLSEALTLWRGPALANVTEQLGEVELPRLEEARMVALESRLEADLELGRHRQILAELTGLVAVYPLRERLRAQLMAALYRCDRQGDALGLYHDGRRVLAEELGVDPGPLLHSVYQDILASELPPVTVPEQVAVRPRPVHPRPETLPPDLADFTGRDKELDQLCDLLRTEQGATSRCSVAVIAGMPGVGKTSLACHAAHLCREEFPDGQLYADLRSHGEQIDPFDVLGSFLRALGVAEEEIPARGNERIRMYRTLLAHRRVLVVLDNASNDRQVRPFLSAASGCAVLVTSSSQLSTVEGAHLVALDPFDDDESLAMLTAVIGEDRLNAERAAAARLVSACGHLPLAIRIAGARLNSRKHLNLRSLAVQLADEEHRLDRLRMGSLDVRARLDASYRGLDRQARTALRRLALLDVPHFAGWVAAAVLDVSEAVGDDIIDVLVDARLLEVVRTGADVTPRYRFHDLVRLLAKELASVEDSADDRRRALDRAFGAWLAVAGEADRRLPDRRAVGANGKALRWRLAGSLLEELLEDPLTWFDSETDTLAAVVEQAAATGRAAVAWEIATALAHHCRLRELYDHWRRTHQRAWTASRATGDATGQAAVLLGLADLAAIVGPPAAQLSYAVLAGELFDAAGDQARHAEALAHRGDAYQKLGSHGVQATWSEV